MKWLKVGRGIKILDLRGIENMRSMRVGTKNDAFDREMERMKVDEADL